jgi:hypothetical protein
VLVGMLRESERWRGELGRLFGIPTQVGAAARPAFHGQAVPSTRR